MKREILDLLTDWKTSCAFNWFNTINSFSNISMIVNPRFCFNKNNVIELNKNKKKIIWGSSLMSQYSSLLLVTRGLHCQDNWARKGVREGFNLDTGRSHLALVVCGKSAKSLRRHWLSLVCLILHAIFCPGWKSFQANNHGQKGNEGVYINIYLKSPSQHGKQENVRHSKTFFVGYSCKLFSLLYRWHTWHMLSWIPLATFVIWIDWEQWSSFLAFRSCARRQLQFSNNFINLYTPPIKIS